MRTTGRERISSLGAHFMKTVFGKVKPIYFVNRGGALEDQNTKTTPSCREPGGGEGSEWEAPAWIPVGQATFK